MQHTRRRVRDDSKKPGASLLVCAKFDLTLFVSSFSMVMSLSVVACQRRCRCHLFLQKRCLMCSSTCTPERSPSRLMLLTAMHCNSIAQFNQQVLWLADAVNVRFFAVLRSPSDCRMALCFATAFKSKAWSAIHVLYPQPGCLAQYAGCRCVIDERSQLSSSNDF
jgi:hypothetical protein